MEKWIWIGLYARRQDREEAYTEWNQKIMEKRGKKSEFDEVTYEAGLKWMKQQLQKEENT